MRLFASSPGEELAGMICCAAGEMFSQAEARPHLAWYLEACRQAGQEVVAHGRILEATREILDRPLLRDPELFVRMANAYLAGRNESPAMDGLAPAGEETGPGSPLPPPAGAETMRDLVSGMALAFNPGAAGDMRAAIQFEVTGDEAGQYYLDIAAGRCRAYEGRHPEPTLTIETPAGVWRDISTGKLDGAAGLITGKYKIQGQMSLLLRLHELFGGANAGKG